MSAVHVGTVGSPNGHAADTGLLRYTFAERLVHWWVALSFTALMLSGFALGYPRMAFLSGLFGGGQTMRFLHPWFGIGFTVGIVWMLVSWSREMRMNAGDRAWVRNMKTYAGSGHSGLDVGKYKDRKSGVEG